MKKTIAFLNGLPRRKDAPGIDDSPWKEKEIGKKLSDNIDTALKALGESSDIIVRRFRFGQTPKEAAIFCIDGLVRPDRIAPEIIKPLMFDGFMGEFPKVLPKSMQDVQSLYMTAGESRTVDFFGELIEAVLTGDAAIFIDGIKGAMLINAKGFPQRNIEDPQTESVLRGPREGFVENLRTNTALLRRRIKSPFFTLETITLGEKTNTPVAIAYIRNVADMSLVKEVRRRLTAIKTDAILDSGYIEQYIGDRGSPFFSTVASSEKPDAVAGKLLEGRVAVFVDGSPYILTAPSFFAESFQTAEDYYIAPLFASTLRTVRFFAFIVSILALPLYVALTTFHQELIPTELLLSMAAAEGNTPFPAVIEALIMILIFEILKEAGIRLPRPAGQAVSMVGAIIIGETAVSAGIIGAPMVIAVATTAVSAFAAPAQANASMILRLLFLLFAGVFGGLGLTLGILLLLLHLGSLSSFGHPYLSPVVPFHLSDNKDGLFRLPLSYLLTRPSTLARRNPRRSRMDP